MNIGFIGLGNGGATLASSLLRHRHSLVVNDLDRNSAAALVEKGARWASNKMRTL